SENFAAISFEGITTGMRSASFGRTRWWLLEVPETREANRSRNDGLLTKAVTNDRVTPAFGTMTRNSVDAIDARPDVSGLEGIQIRGMRGLSLERRTLFSGTRYLELLMVSPSATSGVSPASK